MSLQNKTDLSRVTRRNKQQSPLLILPGEIRNNIYGHLFGDINASRRTPTGKKPYWLGLLMACHSLYYEGKLLPFTLGTWKFNTIEDLNNILPKSTHLQRHLITDVKFLLWDGIPDVLDIVDADEEEWEDYRDRRIARKKKHITVQTSRQSVKTSSKQIKQAEKSAKKAAKMESKGGKLAQDRHRTNTGISHKLPGLRRVEVGSIYHTPAYFGPRFDRQRIMLSLNDAFWFQCRKVFESWLRAGACQRFKLVYLDTEWDVEDPAKCNGSPLWHWHYCKQFVW